MALSGHVTACNCRWAGWLGQAGAHAVDTNAGVVIGVPPLISHKLAED